MSEGPVTVRVVTSSDDLLSIIRESPEINDILHHHFEFGIYRHGHGEAVRASSGAELEAIAEDWAGGNFFLCHDEDGRLPVVFASSEGQGGPIADDLKSALEVIIGLACWQDCLKFSGGGNVKEMEAAAVLLEHDLRRDKPGVDGYRTRVATALSLSRVPLPELVARLRKAVVGTEPNHLVVTESGDEYESLFGDFLIGDNPEWR